MIRAIATFQCPGLPRPDFGPDDDQYTPAGNEVASALSQALKFSGVEVERDDPIEGEGGWHVWEEYAERRCHLFLNATEIGTPLCVAWALGISPVGIFSFLHRAKNDAAINALRTVIEDVLKKTMGCTEIRWWSDDEYQDALEGKAG